MVYGIIGLINFAHGDLFMLGSFFALTLVASLHLEGAGTVATVGGILLLLVADAAVLRGAELVGRSIGV